LAIDLDNGHVAQPGAVLLFFFFAIVIPLVAVRS
jgi:hypothetical protein